MRNFQTIVFIGNTNKHKISNLHWSTSIGLLHWSVIFITTNFTSNTRENVLFLITLSVQIFASSIFCKSEKLHFTSTDFREFTFYNFFTSNNFRKWTMGTKK